MYIIVYVPESQVELVRKYKEYLKRQGKSISSHILELLLKYIEEQEMEVKEKIESGELNPTKGQNKFLNCEHHGYYHTGNKGITVKFCMKKRSAIGYRYEDCRDCEEYKEASKEL